MVLRACLGAGALAPAAGGERLLRRPGAEGRADRHLVRPLADRDHAADEPEAWEVKSKAGAVAFAEHWIDELNLAMASAEVDGIRDLSDQSCQTCLDFADRLELIESRGGRFESEGWKILSLGKPQFLGEGAVVAMRLHEGGEIVQETAQSDPVRNAGGEATWSVEMAWRSGQWQVADFRVVE